MEGLAQPILDSRLIRQALEIWASGGWAMIALAVNALVLFAIGTNIWINFKTRRIGRIPERTWRRWLDEPERRRGRFGRILDFATSAGSISELRARFGELHVSELAPFARDLKFMKRAVSTAPLLGLLGTVTGMLTTFNGLASGSGGQKTMEVVASGISEALITTETGLVIALPGLFFQYHLARERERYESVLAHLETACTQHYCRSGGSTGRPDGR